MIRLTLSMLVLVLALAACNTTTQTSQRSAAPTATATPADRTLYQRLGGYDAIAAVTDDFVGRMVADKQLGKYFIGMSQNSKERLRQHLVDLLCSETRGPCVYVGRDLLESHTGLHITEAEWATSVKLLKATLTKFNVASREQEELIGAIALFKEDIVGI